MTTHSVCIVFQSTLFMKNWLTNLNWIFLSFVKSHNSNMFFCTENLLFYVDMMNIQSSENPNIFIENFFEGPSSRVIRIQSQSVYIQNKTCYLIAWHKMDCAWTGEMSRFKSIWHWWSHNIFHRTHISSTISKYTSLYS